MKFQITFLLCLGLTLASEIIMPNCYNCFAYGSGYFYCHPGVCCEPGSTTTGCNYLTNSSLTCSAQAASSVAQTAFCLNNNIKSKCGATTSVVPDTFKRALFTSASLSNSTGESCLWTLQGNPSDLTTGL